MRQRVLAIVGAIALVAVALLVRSLLGDDDKGSSGGGGDRPVVACTPDLADVCAALAADRRIAADPPTLDLDGAAAPDRAIDGWITWDPAPEIANFDAGGAKVWDEAQVLGSARQAVLFDPVAGRSLPDACQKAPTWACLAADPGLLSFGVGDTATSEGIARLAPLARTFTTQDDPDALDVTGLRDLVGRADDQSDAADQSLAMVTTVGSWDLVTGPNDLLAARAATNRGEQRKLRVLSPTPAHRLVVVLATRAGRDLGAVAEACAKAGDAIGASTDALGLQSCEGARGTDLAGLLYQVREKVG